MKEYLKHLKSQAIFIKSKINNNEKDTNKKDTKRN